MAPEDAVEVGLIFDFLLDLQVGQHLLLIPFLALQVAFETLCRGLRMTGVVTRDAAAFEKRGVLFCLASALLLGFVVGREGFLRLAQIHFGLRRPAITAPTITNQPFELFPGSVILFARRGELFADADHLTATSGTNHLFRWHCLAWAVPVSVPDIRRKTFY